jgi:hypothetical protein
VSIDELIRRYQSGESCAAIAAAMGSRPTTVHARLKRADVKLRPAGRPAIQGPLGATEADLVARYRAGQTCAEIGAGTGLHHSTVNYRLKRAGVAMRPGGSRAGKGGSSCPSRRSSSATGPGRVPARSGAHWCCRPRRSASA